MDNSPVVDVLQRRNNLKTNPGHVSLRDRSLIFEQRCEAFSMTKFHHQTDLNIVLEAVKKLDNVRVFKISLDLNLEIDFVPLAGLCNSALRDDFQCNISVTLVKRLPATTLIY